MIDATCGRGHDTLELARILGPSGKIFGFDVQRDATRSTRALLTETLQYSFTDNLGTSKSGPAVHLLNRSHADIMSCIDNTRVKVVCFNLGYLPWGDKGIVTETESTLKAIQSSLDILQPGGIITVISYVGHTGGLEESEAVRTLTKSLASDKWVVIDLHVANRVHAPILTLVYKPCDPQHDAI